MRIHKKSVSSAGGANALMNLRKKPTNDNSMVENNLSAEMEENNHSKQIGNDNLNYAASFLYKKNCCWSREKHKN